MTEAASEGTLMWEPSEERRRESGMARYMDWLSDSNSGIHKY